MSIRDIALPSIDIARCQIAQIGLRRFSVTLRRRVWSGTYVGDGTPVNHDLVITPTPRVRMSFPSAGLDPKDLEYVLQNGAIFSDRFYTIDRITPRFKKQPCNPLSDEFGGYTPQQLRLKVPPELKNIEMLAILIGDDGIRRDCIQHSLDIDGAFGYSMMVEETDRPRSALQSIVISPAPLSIAVANEVQLVAKGVFEDGTDYDLATLVTWVVENETFATVDVLGLLLGKSAGETTVTARFGDISSAPVALTVS